MTSVVWITGVSAAGKTTIADEIRYRLGWKKESVLLDADEVRPLWPELGLSKEDRNQNVLRMGSLAAIVASQLHDGLVIVACIAPYRAVREKAFASIQIWCPLYEIYLWAPLPVRQARDPKGLYAKALRGEIQGLTGYDGVYEEPTNPSLSFDTSKQTPMKIAKDICDHIF